MKHPITERPLEPAWEAVLREAARHHTTTIRELAEATGLPRAAARNIALALLRRGLLARATRSFDPASGFKRYAFCVTDDGRRWLRRQPSARQLGLLAA